ncbi:MAG: DUF1513 domain-containing protein, partial [Pseudomonadota bacterium]
MHRRAVLAGLAATAAGPVWADLAPTAFLAAAITRTGQTLLCGLDTAGEIVFQHPLAGRGHAAAIHPRRTEAVAFARRPGNFALVLDCASGAQRAELTAPTGRHFYGHGAFSRDGTRLYTTENAFDAGRGVIGVWDAAGGYRRIGELPSGGIGPHEILRLPGSDILVVANGGIETHPESGRAKLNLPFMRPNLSYLSPEGHVLDRVEPPLAWHKASLRHLAVRGDGLVAVACQWQGDPADAVALLATHRMGGVLAFHPTSETPDRTLDGYAGSIAFSQDGTQIAVTAPRGNRAFLHAADGSLLDVIEAEDVCGVAPGPRGPVFTTGGGDVIWQSGLSGQRRSHPDLRWDNHL